MVRTLVCALVGLVLCAGSLLAAEKRAGHATVVKVDGDKMTLSWKDKSGKEMEKTLDVKEDKIALVGTNGKEAMADDFKEGDRVLVTLKNGKVTQIQHDKKGEKPIDPEKPASGKPAPEKPSDK